MGIHATALNALLYGVLAATAFSGALGLYRRGLATGLILGICAGAMLLFVTSPLRTPLNARPGIAGQPRATSNAAVGGATTEDDFGRMSRACMLGVLAGCVFSGNFGTWRYGMAPGVFLALCTGAALLAATIIPLWLTVFSLMPHLW